MTDVTAEIRATAGQTATMDAVRARYKQLCSLRDAAYAKAATVQAKLDAANTREQVARREAMQLAAERMNILGGPDNWLALKREIGQLAKLLGGK